MRFMFNADHGVSNLETGLFAISNYSVISSAGNKHVDLSGNGSTYAAGVGQIVTNSFGIGDRWVHVAFKLPNNTNNTGLVITSKLGVDALSMTVINNTGIASIRRGGLGGTIIATSAAAAVPSGVWHWGWFDLLAQNTAGVASFYLDGNTSPLLTFTGDTTAATTDNWDQLQFWGQDGSPLFDDIVTFTGTEKSAFANGSYPELFASNIAPTSDSTNTFNSGGFASVDETPWSSADYAESLTAGQELICNVTGLAWTPTAVRGVVVQSYVARDGVINQFGGILANGAVQITVKQSCSLATNGALPAYTAAGAGAGKTLTGNAVGVLTVDSVSVVLGNRVLVKEGTAIDNGIYKCTTEGTAGVAFVLTRATDFDNVGPDAEVDTGDVTYVTAGTANGNKTFRLTTADPITVDTTALTFAEMAAYLPSKTGAGAAAYVEGQWLFALNPNGDAQWTYATAITAKPGIQTQTAV